MNITYKNTKEFSAEQLAGLFLSVGWSSGQYPERLTKAMAHSGSVFTAWDGELLVGLVNALDDSEMTAYVHYLLVRPEYQKNGIGNELIRMIKERYADYLRIVLISYNEEVPFYERCGFEASKTSTPVFLTSLWT